MASPPKPRLNYAVKACQIAGIVAVAVIGWKLLRTTPSAVSFVAIFLTAWCGAWWLRKKVSPSTADVAFCVSTVGIVGLILLPAAPEFANLGRRRTVGYDFFVLNVLVMDLVFQQVLKTSLPVWFRGFPYASSVWAAMVPMWPRLVPAFGVALGYDFVAGALLSRRTGWGGRHAWQWYAIAGLCMPAGTAVAWLKWGLPGG